MEALKKIEKKIQSLEQAIKTVQEWKNDNDKIVFTNGCFDLLHLGHLDYLSKAKDLGSKLIIGVNSSESVNRLKGPTRPINPTESRSTMLAAFEFVDLVVIFDDDTPLNLISNLKPNILVKGGDYSPNEVVGYEIVESYGGEVQVLDYFDNCSTTRIVKKIQEK